MAKALLYELGKSASFGRLTILGKVLWPMLLAASDQQGRGLAAADVIKWRICPNVAELTIENISIVLDEMAAEKMILLYGSKEHSRLYQIANWWKYQHPAWACPSKNQAPPGWIDKLHYMARGGRVIKENWPFPSRQSLWLKLRKRILRRDEYLCQYCGAPAQHVDHVIPRCQDGTDDPDNLVAACIFCNLTKSGRTPEQAGMELQR